MAKRSSTAPKSLRTRDARAAWREIVVAYSLDDAAGLMLLESALLAYERMHEARQIIDRDGLLVTGMGGATKQNPCVAIERDSRAGMLAALKSLNLDLEPLRDKLGRPGGDGVTPIRRTLTAVS